MADATDTQHWLDLIEETTKRLHARQRQRAQFGYETPPYILTEIEQCEKDIELYRAQLTVGLPPSQKAQNEVPGDAQQVLIKAQLKEIREENAAANTFVIEKINHIDAKTEAYRNADIEIRQERQSAIDRHQQESNERLTKLERQFDEALVTMSRVGNRLDWSEWKIAGMLFVAIIIIWLIR